MCEITYADDVIGLRTCSRCHSTKLIINFGINNKSAYFKTCNTCRLRNTRKTNKHLNHEFDLSDTNIILTGKYKIMFSTEF